MATASDSDLNLELLGARPSASAEAALRRQCARVRAMSAEERVKYASLFPRYDTDGDGAISGRESAELLGKSGLEKPVLKRVRPHAFSPFYSSFCSFNCTVFSSQLKRKRSPIFF